MKVFGVSMMKDEVDVCVHVVKHLLESEKLDGVIVADNGSTDGTRERLERYADSNENLMVVDDYDPAYAQSEKMTGLANDAAMCGADWIVPFDADEVWYDPDMPIGDRLRGLGDDVGVVHAPIWNHYGSGLDDPNEQNPFKRMRWRVKEQGALPKVAVRWSDEAVIDMGNHSARTLAGNGRDRFVGIALRHFPYRSDGQFITKARNGAAAYKAAGDRVPANAGAHWREYGAILERFGEDVLVQDVYEKWFYDVAPQTAGRVYDPAPWMRWA